ncbi:hypothetical protein FA13DRAFT_304544 [Coprinellus micaceus]|uniref:Uncharacterized protein n=1 Tax=Coprinellus micaceus TaxID=71717 RepID=A0A4Y7SDJ6_COPMI|nr:hypothetical protein FA13DRAFT_304544 [Coprinellus micaceus]
MARRDAPQTGNDYYRTSALEPKPPTGEVKVKFPTIGAPLDPTPMSSRCSSSTPSTTHFTSSPPTSLPESLVSLSDTRRRQATQISKDVVEPEDNSEPLGTASTSRVSSSKALQASASASTIRASTNSPPSIPAAQTCRPALDILDNDTTDDSCPKEGLHDNSRLNSSALSWDPPSLPSSPTSLSPLLWSPPSSPTQPAASPPLGLSIFPLEYTSSDQSPGTCTTESLETAVGELRTGESLWGSTPFSEKRPTPISSSSSRTPTPTQPHARSPTEARQIRDSDVIIM